MARYVYIRCSTDKQEYLQQKNAISTYFDKYGIDANSVDKTIEEHVSGYKVSYKQRQLYGVIKNLKQNDVLFVSDVSRLSRRLNEIFEITNIAFEVGASIVLCGYNMVLEKDSIATKSFLFGVGIGAEIQVMNISADTKRALQVRKEYIKEQGGFRSKSGRWCTSLGQKKGFVSTEAIEAAAVANSESSAQWREKSMAYQLYKQKKRAGWSDVKILELFNELSEVRPDDFLTRQGKPITAYTLSRWGGFFRKENEIKIV